MMIFSKLLGVLKTRISSTDIKYEILTIVGGSKKNQSNKEMAMQEAISILENSKTEQEALQKIQKAFAE